MDATAATLYGAAIAGLFTVIGVVAALVVEDRLRRRGEVRFEVRSWVGGTTSTTSGESRVFEARFFNGRDVIVSLWNLEVEFYDGEAVIARMLPKRAANDPTRSGPTAEPIELPSRTSVYQTTRLETRGEFLEKVKGADRALFVAVVVPGNDRISAPLRPWSPLEEAQPWSAHRTS